MSVASPTRPRRPAVWTAVQQLDLTPEEKTAAITKVRCLEHELFDGAHVCRQLSRKAAEAILAELNQLRATLGWLKIDVEGRWRWSHKNDG